MVDPIRVAAHIHGHAGWLAAAALVHPAILLRDPRRRAHLSVGLATGLATVAAALGAFIYPAYSAGLRHSIFVGAPQIGWLFERKEHLAFGAIVLVWTGALAYVAAEQGKGDLRAALRTIAFRAFALATGLVVVVATLGTMVAVYKGF